MKKLSRIFLIFAALGFLSLVVSRLVLGVFMPFMWILAALSTLFLVGVLWTERRIVFEFFSTKTTKEGLSLGASTVLIVVGLGLVNYVGSKYSKSFDFSEAQVNSLSEQSVQLLKQLDQDLRIVFFYQEGAAGVEQTRRSFLTLVKKYQDQSSKVKLDFIDVNERPALAEEYGVNKGTGLVFVVYKERKNRVDAISEQDLTLAIANALRERDKKVYFSIGHGERSLNESQENGGLAALRQILEGNRYQTFELNLNSTGAVPEDADLFVIAGATQAMLEPSVKAIEAYLRRGGQAILALEPSRSGTQPLETLLKQIGIRVSSDIVVQVMNTPLGRAINPGLTPAGVFPGHAITNPFGSSQFIVTRLPQRIEALTSVEGISTTELVKTEANTFAFKNTQFEEQTAEGPFAVAVLSTGKLPGAEKEFQVVTLADADLLGNQLLFQNLNRDFVLNMFSFLSKEENMISITPKEIQRTELVLTETKFVLFIFGFLIPLPILMLGAAGLIWYRRRYV
jgi:ABC-type uncharacterized transport system involved in gliding motility auxiliary subunit